MNPKTDYAIITCAACGMANRVPLRELVNHDDLVDAGACRECGKEWGMVFYLKEN